MIYKFSEIFAGKKKYQKLFESLFELSLRGMNIGGGADPLSSGERYASEYVNQKLSGVKSIIIFDVGANVGNYSLMLKNIFGDKARIFSFEPSRLTFKKLESNTSHVTNIKPLNFGFGEEKTKLKLYYNTEESILASIYQRKLDHINIDMNKSEEICIETIDGFCEKNDIQHIHLLKLDVEGHELKVLQGASSILNSGQINFIQFEFGGCNIDSRTYFQDFFYLLKDNYTIYRIVKDGLCKIEKYKEMYEAFITTNYLAEKKEVEHYSFS